MRKPPARFPLHCFARPDKRERSVTSSVFDFDFSLALEGAEKRSARRKKAVSPV
jgi:hypothetical protein